MMVADKRKSVIEMVNSRILGRISSDKSSADVSRSDQVRCDMSTPSRKGLDETRSNKRTSAIVGILYIIGTVSGGLSLNYTEPIRKAGDILGEVQAHGSQVILGAFFVFLMGLALAAIPVLVYPILKKHSEIAAVGYVVFRGCLETVTYMATVMCWLALLPLSKVYSGVAAAGAEAAAGAASSGAAAAAGAGAGAEAAAGAADSLQALGLMLIKTEFISPVLSTVFCIGALVFYCALYRWRLVPRWLSSWGLAAVPLYLAAGLLDMFDVISALSLLGVGLNMPLAIQEMVLALWLIFKGFDQRVAGTP